MPSATTNGANGVNGHSGSALCSLDEFLRQDYDYVVVGGGTAGLVVAARLTENPDVTVGVLEAGSNRMDDKQVSTPSLYPALIGRDQYDWRFNSVPQVLHLSSSSRWANVDVLYDGGSLMLGTKPTACLAASFSAAAAQ